MKVLDLIGIGECMVEFWSEVSLETADSFRRAHAGDVCNALVSAARLGSRCGFVTQLGSDPFARGLLEFWRGEQLDLTLMRQVDADNGVYFISVDAHGERSFTYRRAASAASQITPDLLQADYIASSHTLLLSGITQAISASAQATTLLAAQIARQRGVRVAFDPNYRERLWQSRGGLPAARAAYLELLPYVDVLLPSYPDDAPVLLGATPTSLEQFALELPAPLVVVKAGERGAMLNTDAQIQHIPATPVAAVVDSSGAGDAWNGAFLHYWRDHAPHVAAARANEVAARTLGFRGAIPPRGVV